MRYAEGMPEHTTVHGERLREWSLGGLRLTETNHGRRERLEAHAHEGASLCFLLRGGFVERHGRAAVDCAPASLVWRAPGSEHADIFGEGGAHCFNVELAPELLRGRAAGAGGGLDASGGKIAWAATRLLSAARGATAADALLVEERALALVSELWPGPTPRAAPRHVRRAAELLRARAFAPWSLAGVAHEAGLHPMHLARAFRHAFGESVGQFVRRLRVEAATRELARSNAGLAEIAASTGFADQAHLTRVFRRLTGLTPGRFRASVRGTLRSFNT